MFCLLLLPSIFPSIRVFSNSQLFASDGQRIGASALVSILPMNIQGWYPSGLTVLLSFQSKGLSRVLSSTTIQKHQFFGLLSLLYGPTHTSIHDYWKNHCFCVLGSQENWVQSAEISHVLNAPTHAWSPPFSTFPTRVAHLWQLITYLPWGIIITQSP